LKRSISTIRAGQSSNIENVFKKSTCTHLTDDRYAEILDKPREISCDCGHGQRRTGVNGSNDELLECVRVRFATWMLRHVHPNDLKGKSEFFFNHEMEDDLVLNLATDNAVPGSSRVVHVKKGGKWTDR